MAWGAAIRGNQYCFIIFTIVSKPRQLALNVGHHLMTTEVLTTLPSSLDANMLKSKLESEGIYCFLVNENFTDWFPAYYGILGAGVQVVVKKEDIEKARDLARLTTGPVACPSCGSENVTLSFEKPKRKFTLLFIGLILASLLGNLLSDYECQDCTTAFRQ